MLTIAYSAILNSVFSLYSPCSCSVSFIYVEFHLPFYCLITQDEKLSTVFILVFQCLHTCLYIYKQFCKFFIYMCNSIKIYLFCPFITLVLVPDHLGLCCTAKVSHGNLLSACKFSSTKLTAYSYTFFPMY